MEVTREKKLQVLYERVLTLPVEQREEFLWKTCPNDPTLIQDVLKMLASTGQAAPAQDAGWIGPYHVEGLLGRGGMGEVWRAVRGDGAFTKVVAIKIMTTPLEGDGQFLQRFRQERQLLANLDHPGIARILDGGELSDGRPYMVMDFIDGLPLDKHCAERRLTIEDQVRLMIQVCEAVDFLHKSGIIHRDLKPGNVMVNTQGQVKLLDFGIAKVSSIAVDPLLTAPQHRMMTPGYASPEQMAGETCTPQSDVYSLGAVLYRLITRQTPSLSAPTMPSTLLASGQAGESAAPRPLPRHELGDLDGIIMKALEHNPAKRYNTALELAEDLKRFLSGTPVTARTLTFGEKAGRSLRRNPAVVAIAALVLIGVVAGGGAFWYRGRQTPAPTPAPAVAEQARPAEAPKPAVPEPESTPSAPPVQESNPSAGAPPANVQSEPAPAQTAPAPRSQQPVTRAGGSAASTAAPATAAPVTSAPAASAPAAHLPGPSAPATSAPPASSAGPPPGWLDRLTNVSVKVATASGAFQQKQKELAASGLTPSPDLLSSNQQMQTCLDAAQSFAKSGDWDAAKDYLSRADAFATRLLKALGR